MLNYTDDPTEGTWFWDVNPAIDIIAGKSYENWHHSQQKGERENSPPYCGGFNRKD